MKSDPTARRVMRALDLGLLRSLLTGIEAGLHDSGPGHPHLAVAVEGFDADGIEVAVRELGRLDVIDALAGLAAPASWSAFGLLCEGRSRPASPHGGEWRADAEARADPARIGVLVDRSGRAVAGLRTDDTGFVTLPDHESALGRVPDACRRVLGLGTPPPEQPASELWARWWVERTLGEALGRPGAVSWAEVVRLHPGVIALLGSDHSPPDDPTAPGGSAADDDLLTAGHRVAADIGWARLREQCAAGAVVGLEVRPEVAAWMDDGMFSRDVLGLFPPLDLLTAELEPVVAPDVVDAMIHALERWGMA